MDILVRELTDVVSNVPDRQVIDLETYSILEEKVEDHAIMSLVNVGTAIIAASISIIMQ